MLTLARCLLMTMLLAATAVTGGLRAASADEWKDPVDAAQQELRSGGFPWYQRDEDRLQALPAPPAPPIARHRGSTWENQPAAPSASRRTRPTRWGSGTTRFFEVLAWIILVLLIVAIVVGLVWAYLRSESSSPRRQTEKAPEQRDLSASFESLPFVLEAAKADLLTEARRAFDAEDYRRAIVLLFSYKLIALDQRQRIYLAKGKTNRQYLRELRGHPALQRVLEQTMLLFEDAYFGDYQPTRSDLNAAWEQLELFHRELEPVPT